VKLLSSENRWKDLKNYLEEIHQKYYNVDFIMLELINIYYKLEQYSKVITEGEQYLEAHPYDNEILLKVSRCYLITKNYEKAIELSERLDLREPNNVSNLFTLVNCYNLIGDKKRAIKVLNRLLDLAPEKEETKRLRNLILGY
jgi:tetratricopeptide (TPR) repeat protein